MMICRGQLILMMDADGATRVSDVEKLEAALEKVAVKGALCNFLWLPGLAVLESMVSELISAYQTNANAATTPHLLSPHTTLVGPPHHTCLGPLGSLTTPSGMHLNMQAAIEGTDNTCPRVDAVSFVH